MIHRILIIYSFVVRALLFFLPDIPPVMRVRGFLYWFWKKENNRQVAHSVKITGLENLRLGSNVYLANDINIIANGTIDIKKDTIIGPNSTLVSSRHIFSDNSYRFAKSVPENIVIEEGCWIGANSVVTGNSCLPRKSILAAGGVLTSEMHQEFSLYGGVPAKHIKSL